MNDKIIVGYTTGVFDMFHIGHLNIIKKAKENCDYLIVGVSTDEVVFNYKNRKPMISFEERVEIVKAIRYVDEVVPQISMDKYEAWKKLHFNRLFHGHDWKGSEMYIEIENRLIKEGVEIIYFPYTQGTSSSILKRALLEKSVIS